jgi:hypothetical protein
MKKAQKVYSISGECAKSILAYMENTANVGLFAVHKIFSKYTENMNSIQIIGGKNLLYDSI